MKAPLSQVPLLPLAAGLMAGIVIGRYLSDYAVYIVIALALGSVVSAWFRKWGAAAMLAAMICGEVLIGAFHYNELEQVSGEDCEYRGRVEEVIERESSRSMVVNVEGLPYNVYITTPAFNPELLPGDDIAFVCALRPVESDQDAFYNLNDFYYERRIGAMGFVLPEGLRIVNGEELTFKQWLVRQRQVWVRTIMHSDMEQGAARLLVATFLGERGVMDDGEITAFRDAGAAHVLALSGLHAALVWLIITIVLWPLKLAGNERLVKGVAILLLWAYVVFTGLAPSVIRASVMVTMVAIGELIGRRSSSVNSLLAAAIVILIISPEALFEVGFQLSFVAVAGLLIWSGWFQTIEIKRQWLRWLVNVIGVTMAAMVATSVFTAYYFHRLPLLFLLVNIPLAVLFPAFLGFGVVWSLLAFTVGNCAPLIWVIDALYLCMKWIVDSVAAMGGSVLTNLYLTPWSLLVWVNTIVAAGCWAYYRRAVWGCAIGACVATLVALIAIPPVVNKPELIIESRRDHTMLMVNDGDKCRAFIVGLPKDSAYLTEFWRERLADYAGNRRIGKPEVQPLTSTQLHVGNSRWLIVNSNNTAPVDCDEILICRGYSGDACQIEKLISGTGARRVYLSGDLNAKISKRLANQLVDMQGVEVMSLRDSYVVIPLSNRR